MVAALAAWDFATGGRPPLLSTQMRLQLERSELQLDRLWGRGAAAAKLVRLIAGWAEDCEWEGEEVRSLGFYVRSIKQTARESRRQQRRAPAPRPWRPRGTKERA